MKKTELIEIMAFMGLFGFTLFVSLDYFDNFAPGDLCDYTIYTIKGHSMEPSFKEGDQIKICRKFDHKNIKIGDNIVFSDGKELVFHKVTKINLEGQKNYVTKGTNNQKPDNPINKSQVVGVFLDRHGE